MEKLICDFCDEEAVEFWEEMTYCKRHWEQALAQADAYADSILEQQLWKLK